MDFIDPFGWSPINLFSKWATPGYSKTMQDVPGNVYDYFNPVPSIAPRELPANVNLTPTMSDMYTKIYGIQPPNMVKDLTDEELKRRNTAGPRAPQYFFGK